MYRDKFLRSIAVPHKMRWLCASVLVCLYDEKKVWSLIVVIDVVAVCVCVCVRFSSCLFAIVYGIYHIFI